MEGEVYNGLIVTSLVCNEVAEQLLYLRGHPPSSGLTDLVDWYVKAVNAGKTTDPSGHYFACAGTKSCIASS